MMDYVYFGVMALLIVIEILNFKERKDLYNRLMARDLTDYQTNSNKKPARATKNILKTNMDQHHNDV